MYALGANPWGVRLHRPQLSSSLTLYYFEKPTAYGLSTEGLVLQGPLFLMAGKSPLRMPFRPWEEPIPAEQLPKYFRRERGQFVEHRSGEVRVRPEPYEKRLLRVLLLARKNLADVLAREGNLAEAARLYESILRLDPWMAEEVSVVYPLAVVEVGLKRYDLAELRFKKALSLELSAAKRAEAYYFLAALCGNRPEAAEWKAKALASPDLSPELRAKIEGR